MVVYNTANPLYIYEYKLVSAIHPATNRIGTGFSTAMIKHDDMVESAVFYKKKLVAVMRDNVWVAALDSNRKYPKLPEVVEYHSPNEIR